MADRLVYLTLGPNRAQRRAKGYRLNLHDLGHPISLCPPAKKLIFEASVNKPFRHYEPPVPKAPWQEMWS